MKFYQAVLLLVLNLGLLACTPDQPQGVLTDAQQKTLDKARQTEDVLKKANEERLKKLDETVKE